MARIRILCFSLSVAFFLTNTLLVHALESNLWSERRQTRYKRVPPIVRERVENVVIHIQDIHQNQEAQKDISRTLSKLIEQNQVDLVALEGAFDSIHLEPYHTFPFQRSLQKVADYLLTKNKIGGPLHSLLTKGNASVAIVGVDDKFLYEKNVEAVQQAHARKKQAKEKWEAQVQQLAEKKKIIFNSNLMAFDQNVRAYRTQKIKLSSYIELLTKESHSFESLDTFKKAHTLEQNLNWNAIGQQRSRLLSALLSRTTTQQAQTLIQKSADTKSGLMRRADFYKDVKWLCESIGLSLTRYPDMKNYLDYVLLSDTLNARQLMREMKQAEKKRYAVLAETKQERVLVQESDRLYLAGKLLDLSLTREEWEEAKEITDYQFGPFFHFYDWAEKRDKKIAENVLKAMKKKKAKSVVLVTGGFHSRGINKRLADENITTVTLTPKITRIHVGEESHTLNAFSQEKTPLEKLFTGQKLLLSQRAWTPHQQFLTSTGLIGDAVQMTDLPNTKAAKTAFRQFGLAHLFPLLSATTKGNQSTLIHRSPKGKIRTTTSSTEDRVTNLTSSPYVSIPGETKTHRFPLYIWRVLKKRLLSVLGDTHEDYDRIVRQGQGVARSNSSGEIIFESDVVLEIVVKTLNDLRTNGSMLSLNDVKAYLLFHERLHVLLGGRSHYMMAVSRALKDYHYTSETGRVIYPYKRIKAHFANNYGDEYGDPGSDGDLSFIEELIVVFWTELTLLRQPVRLLKSKRKGSAQSDRYGISMKVYDLIEDALNKAEKLSISDTLFPDLAHIEAMISPDNGGDPQPLMWDNPIQGIAERAEDSHTILFKSHFDQKEFLEHKRPQSEYFKLDLFAHMSFHHNFKTWIFHTRPPLIDSLYTSLKEKGFVGRNKKKFLQKFNWFFNQYEERSLRTYLGVPSHIQLEPELENVLAYYDTLQEKRIDSDAYAIFYLQEMDSVSFKIWLSHRSPTHKRIIDGEEESYSMLFDSTAYANPKPRGVHIIEHNQAREYKPQEIHIDPIGYVGHAAFNLISQHPLRNPHQTVALPLDELLDLPTAFAFSSGPLLPFLEMNRTMAVTHDLVLTKNNSDEEETSVIGPGEKRPKAPPPDPYDVFAEISARSWAGQSKSSLTKKQPAALLGQIETNLGPVEYLNLNRLLGDRDARLAPKRMINWSKQRRVRQQT